MPGKPNDKWLKTMTEKLGSREAVREHQSRIGSLGGQRSRGGGFAYGEIGREKARIAGAKGGRISKRTKKEE